MKFVLVFAVVLIGFFIWRSNRAADKAASVKPKPQPEDTTATNTTRAIEMVRCDVCGLHCPKVDAVTGRRGVYCTAQHRQQAEP